MAAVQADVVRVTEDIEPKAVGLVGVDGRGVLDELEVQDVQPGVLFGCPSGPQSLQGCLFRQLVLRICPLAAISHSCTEVSSCADPHQGKDRIWHDILKTCGCQDEHVAREYHKKPKRHLRARQAKGLAASASWFVA